MVTPFRWISILISSLVVLGACRSAGPVEPVSLSTVVLVRHAEKAPVTAEEARTEAGRDPELSERGRARAEALADLLSSTGVTHLFATQYRRTRQTLAPLAARTGREVVPIDAHDSAAIVAALRGLPPGSTAVVAGHSNTVPAIALGLGLELPGLVTQPEGAMLRDSEYDRVFVLTLDAAGRVTPRLVELKGAASAYAVR